MRVAIVIPARYASTRLPAKPLLRETGKYLIQHVYERACQCRYAEQVIVATDDSRIESAVHEFAGRVVMTRVDHVSGTDRIAEVAAQLAVDVVVNLQGDEPLFDPEAIDDLVELLEKQPDTQIATLATPIRDPMIYHSPNSVKVVCSDQGQALYFSRSPIPYVRDLEPDFQAEPARFLLHLGVYAYRRDTLLAVTKAPPHLLELQEKLEQLRWLALGYKIGVGIIPHAHRGVDTPEDYAEFVRMTSKK